jgi:hypothetical protein
VRCRIFGVRRSHARPNACEIRGRFGFLRKPAKCIFFTQPIATKETHFSSRTLSASDILISAGSESAFIFSITCPR